MNNSYLIKELPKEGQRILYKYDMAYIIESQWNLGVTKFSLDWALKYKH